MVNINTTETYLAFKRDIMARIFTLDELRRFLREAIQLIKQRAEEIGNHPNTTRAKKFTLIGTEGLIGDLTDDKVNTFDALRIYLLFEHELAITILSFNTFTGGYTDDTVLKLLLRSASMITITGSPGLRVPMSNVASITERYEERSLESGIDPYEPLAPARNSLMPLRNNLAWTTVLPSRIANPLHRKLRNRPRNAIIAVGPVRNHPVKNTRRLGVREERNRRTHVNNRGIFPGPLGKLNNIAQANKVIKNNPNNSLHVAAVAINKGANPAGLLPRMRLMPRGPIGNVPPPYLPALSAEHYVFRTVGGTRKKKNK